MSPENSSDQEAREAFAALTALVNQLSFEERAALRTQLGVYTHDLKHTLGLITGANAILKRKAATDCNAEPVVEMTAMIEKAALQLDGLIMMLVEGLNNQIEAD